MTATQATIIGSPSTDYPYMMYVNNSGAVPVAGYSGGTVYPLLVNTAGELLTSATVSIGSVDVTVGSDAFMWGYSGGTWYRVLSTPTGKLVTETSVSVTTGSESYIYGKSGTGWTELFADTEGRLGVRNLGFGVDINVGSTGAIVANTETMATEHTISSGSIYNLIGFDGTGTADAKFRVWHNGSIQVMLRINPAERNIQKTFSYPISYTTGSVILTAEHTNTNSQNFDGTLYGVETST